MFNVSECMHKKVALYKSQIWIAKLINGNQCLLTCGTTRHRQMLIPTVMKYVALLNFPCRRQSSSEGVMQGKKKKSERQRDPDAVAWHAVGLESQ